MKDAGVEAMLKAVENHPNICLLSIEVGACTSHACITTDFLWMSLVYIIMIIQWNLHNGHL